MFLKTLINLVMRINLQITSQMRVLVEEHLNWQSRFVPAITPEADIALKQTVYLWNNKFVSVITLQMGALSGETAYIVTR